MHMLSIKKSHRVFHIISWNLLPMKCHENTSCVSVLTEIAIKTMECYAMNDVSASFRYFSLQKPPHEYVGELLVSLNYFPTTQRLTIVILKARNLKIESTSGLWGMYHVIWHHHNDMIVIYSWHQWAFFRFCRSTGFQARIELCRKSDIAIIVHCSINSMVFQIRRRFKFRTFYVRIFFLFIVGPAVKVFLMLNKTRLGRKRTAMQKKTLNPVYNEAFTFKVTSDALQRVTFKIVVVNKHSHGADQTIGHALLGQQVTGSGFSHWNHMLASLRKPIAMWHAIIPGA